MLWSVAVAVGILSGIVYLLTFPEAAAALARSKDDDEEYDDDQRRSGGQEDCDLAWKARVKVCDRISKAREDLCASRRRITKAQKQIHNLKVAARQVHMQTIMISSNLTRELIDHHSSGQEALSPHSGSPISMQQQVMTSQQKKQQQQPFARRKKSSSEELKHSKSRSPQNSKTCSSCGSRGSTTKTVFEEDYISGSFVITFEDYIEKLISSSTCATIWGTECCSSDRVVEKFFQPPEESEFADSDFSELSGFKKQPVCEITEVKIETQDNWQDTELDEVEDKDTEIGQSFELLIRGEKSTSTSDIPTSNLDENVQMEEGTEEIVVMDTEKIENDEDAAKLAASEENKSSANVEGTEGVTDVAEIKSGEEEDKKQSEDGQEARQSTVGNISQIGAEIGNISQIGAEFGEQISLLLHKLLATYLPEREDKPIEKVVIDQVFVIDEEKEPATEETSTSDIPIVKTDETDVVGDDTEEIVIEIEEIKDDEDVAMLAASEEVKNEQSENEKSPPDEEAVPLKEEAKEDAIEDVKESQEPINDANEEVKESQEKTEEPPSEDTPGVTESTPDEQSSEEQPKRSAEGGAEEILHDENVIETGIYQLQNTEKLSEKDQIENNLSQGAEEAKVEENVEEISVGQSEIAESSERQAEKQTENHPQDGVEEVTVDENTKEEIIIDHFQEPMNDANKDVTESQQKIEEPPSEDTPGVTESTPDESAEEQPKRNTEGGAEEILHDVNVNVNEIGTYQFQSIEYTEKQLEEDQIEYSISVGVEEAEVEENAEEISMGQTEIAESSEQLAEQQFENNPLEGAEEVTSDENIEEEVIMGQSQESMDDINKDIEESQEKIEETPSEDAPRMTSLTPEEQSVEEQQESSVVGGPQDILDYENEIGAYQFQNTEDIEEQPEKDQLENNLLNGIEETAVEENVEKISTGRSQIVEFSEELSVDVNIDDEKITNQSQNVAYFIKTIYDKPNEILDLFRNLQEEKYLTSQRMNKLYQEELSLILLIQNAKSHSEATEYAGKTCNKNHEEVYRYDQSSEKLIASYSFELNKTNVEESQACKNFRGFKETINVQDKIEECPLKNITEEKNKLLIPDNMDCSILKAIEGYQTISDPTIVETSPKGVLQVIDTISEENPHQLLTGKQTGSASINKADIGIVIKKHLQDEENEVHTENIRNSKKSLSEKSNEEQYILNNLQGSTSKEKEELYYNELSMKLAIRKSKHTEFVEKEEIVIKLCDENQREMEVKSFEELAEKLRYLLSSGSRNEIKEEKLKEENTTEKNNVVSSNEKVSKIINPQKIEECNRKDEHKSHIFHTVGIDNLPNRKQGSIISLKLEENSNNDTNSSQLKQNGRSEYNLKYDEANTSILPNEEDLKITVTDLSNNSTSSHKLIQENVNIKRSVDPCPIKIQNITTATKTCPENKQKNQKNNLVLNYHGRKKILDK